MRQISFFDIDYMKIIHKVKKIIRQVFVNVVTKIQDVIKIDRGWKYQEVKMELNKI